MSRMRFRFWGIGLIGGGLLLGEKGRAKKKGKENHRKQARGMIMWFAL